MSIVGTQPYEIVNEYNVRDILAHFDSITDKNVLYDCPDCGSVDQLVYDAENGKFHCFACEKNYATEELAFCEQCGSLMHRNGDSSICQNCVDIIMDE